MEHSLHLVAKHFIETITPCLSKKDGTIGTGALAKEDVTIRTYMTDFYLFISVY